jgi:excisionase family DNA binding protein
MLLVDRTTIYRMAESGRLPGIKVGNQWRFPRRQVESWLQRQTKPAFQITSHATEAVESGGDLFPLECVQLIQDSFADALGVMIVVTDLEGRPITQPSNRCGLLAAIEEAPQARQRCVELWIKLAHEPALSPRFLTSHIGLLCARGLIRVGNEIKAMLVVGGVAPAEWPPSDPELAVIAERLDVELAVIRDHLYEVHFLTAERQVQVLSFVQRVADILAHIADERQRLFDRLQRIAEISRL